MDYRLEDWYHFLNDFDIALGEKEIILKQVEISYKFGVPVILDLNHLSLLLGVKLNVLVSMINSPKSFYRTFKIPKRSGGVREIVAPRNSLLECQQFIAKEILSSFKINNSAYAYRKKLNIMKNAENHIGQDYMLKIDLKDFFGHIKINRVRELFNRVGYNKDIAYYLSKLCCLDDKLPQGAGSSPLISNIILKSMDNKFEELTEKYNWKYSRYADDLVFSSSTPIFPSLIQHIRKIIKVEGFVINEEKTRLYDPETNKIVTGLFVGKDRIRLPKRKRREIRQEVYFLKKNGILKQVEKNKDLFALERILGKLYFWKQVEPDSEFVLKSIKEMIKLKSKFY